MDNRLKNRAHMVEKYFQLNISSVVFIRFQEASYGEKKTYLCDHHTYVHQELKCRKGGCRGQKKTLHAIKVTSILMYA